MDELHGPPLKLPRIFIEGQDDVLEEFFLIVYQVGEYVVCCFFLSFFLYFSRNVFACCDFEGRK